MRPVVLLSFDAEEFDLPLELGQEISTEEQMRVGAEGMRRTLEMLGVLAKDSGTKMPATFFCTSAFARAAPELIRRAVACGHEIASHGCLHSSWEDEHLGRSKRELEEVSGRACAGFRRARLAETDRGLIERAGYLYNSSENPIWLPGRYNRFFAQRLPYRTGGLLNIPASATPLIRWPLFWLSFKVMPLWVTKLMTRWVMATSPALVLYFHPWELCELGKYKVPLAAKRCNGGKMTVKLARYLGWLAGRWEFASYGEFAAGYRAHSTNHSSQN